MFGDSGDNDIGYIEYDHGSNQLALGTNAASGLKIDSTGAVTKPLQPAFLARPASEQSDLAVSSGITVVFGTEVYDVNGDFASNTFTAPVTGVYAMSLLINTGDYDSSAAYVWLNLVTSSRTDKIFIQGTGLDADSYHFLGGTAIVDMDANDTATVTIQVGGIGGDTADIGVDSSFYGWLVA